MGAATAARANARPDRDGNGLLTRLKTGEKILDRRAKGETVERIAQGLRLDATEVAEFIKIRRRGGDARALTDTQARVTARRSIDAPAPVAEVAAPVAPPPPRPRRVPRIVRVAVDPFGLGAYLARMRGCAKVAGRAHADAAAGIEHLADLHERCPTFYPTYVVPTEHTTFEETRRRFPDRRVVGTFSSPSASCVES